VTGPRAPRGPERNPLHCSIARMTCLATSRYAARPLLHLLALFVTTASAACEAGEGSCVARPAVLEEDQSSFMQLALQTHSRGGSEAHAVQGAEQIPLSHHNRQNVQAMFKPPDLGGLHGLTHDLADVNGTNIPLFFLLPVPTEYQDMNLRQKLADLMPHFLADCLARPYGNEHDCRRADRLLTAVTWFTIQTPDDHLLLDIQQRLGLSFYLWLPGPPFCFTALDKDQDGGLSWTREVAPSFGPGTMLRLNPMKKYMDADNDGNLTRPEIGEYLRAAVLLRDQLPEVDGLHPDTPTEACMDLAEVVGHVPTLPRHMSKPSKVIALIAIFILSGVVGVYFSCYYGKGK